MGRDNDVKLEIAELAKKMFDDLIIDPQGICVSLVYRKLPYDETTISITNEQLKTKKNEIKPWRRKFCLCAANGLNIDLSTIRLMFCSRNWNNIYRGETLQKMM